MWQYRKSDQGNIQTNLRLGRYDFLIRYRNKGDTTPWKFITPIRIPNTFPKPELNLMKNNVKERTEHRDKTKMSSQQEESKEQSSPAASDYEFDDYSNSQSELHLRKAAKHQMSRSPDSQETTPKKLHHETSTKKNTTNQPMETEEDTMEQNTDRNLTDKFEKTPSITSVQEKLPNNVTIRKVITTPEVNLMNEDGC